MEECKWSYAKDGTHREFILPGPFHNAKGKKICQDCCKYLGLIEPIEKEASGPATPVTQEDRDAFHMLQAGTLPEWETKFISDIAKRHELSAKQRKIFERVKSQFIKTTAKKEEPAKYDIPDDAFDLF